MPTASLGPFTSGSSDRTTLSRKLFSVYQTYLTGMNSPSRPVGSFCFSAHRNGQNADGGINRGKLIGDPRAMIQNRLRGIPAQPRNRETHRLASRLSGSPRKTHPVLSQEVLNQFHTETVTLSFLLFDEIEKASDALWNLLLGVLDKAVLTLETRGAWIFRAP